MMLAARTMPDQYERLPLIVVAATAGEWRRAFEHARATGAGPQETIEVLTHQGDALEGWRRKRGLPRGTSAPTLAADARVYATEHPADLAEFDQMMAGIHSFLSKIGGR